MMFRTVPSRIVAFVIVAVALLRVHVAAQGIPTFERYIVTNAIYHEATDMVELPDSDLVFSGYVHFAGGISDGLLMRTDKNAQLEWMRTYSSPDGPVELKRTVFTNGSLYVLGDQAGVILSKLDTSGAPQWAKRLSFGPRTLSRQLQQTLDGNLLVAATDSIGTILTRLDVNGVVVWSKRYKSAYASMPPAVDVVELADSSLTIISTVVAEDIFEESYVVPQLLFMRTDAAGNLLMSERVGVWIDWSNPQIQLPYDWYFYGEDLFHTSDGGYVASITALVPGVIAGGQQELWKFNASGDPVQIARGITQAPLRTLEESPPGTLRIAELGAAPGDILWPILPQLFTTDLLLAPSMTSTRYLAPGFSTSMPGHDLCFQTSKRMGDGRIAYVGRTEVYNSDPYSGISIVLADTSASEPCTTDTVPFNFTFRTPFPAYPVALTVDSPLVVSPVTLTPSLVLPMNCGCASMPVAHATYEVLGQTITFTNNSTGAVSYQWNFGDGTGDVAPSPVHAYADTGSYTIIFYARNACGLDAQVFQHVHIGDMSTGVSMGSWYSGELDIFPNPASDELTIRSSNARLVMVVVISADGRIVLRATHVDDRLSVAALSSGVYTLVAKDFDGVERRARFVKR